MFDLVVRGGLVIDGSGSPPIRADIGVKDGLIQAIGDLGHANASRTLLAEGRVVCPGFIDLHTHSDLAILDRPTNDPKLLQGITTEVLGLDGLSYAPMSLQHRQEMRRYMAGLNGNPAVDWEGTSVRDYLSALDRRCAQNAAFLLPHAALRLETTGWTDRPMTGPELIRMQGLLAGGLSEGAIGWSTGLDYFPCRYADRRELLAIGEVLAEQDRVSVWHVRKLDLGLLPAIEEAVTIGEMTGVRVHISHFGASGPGNAGLAPDMMRIVDEARARGARITFDSYPYAASSTSLLLFLPRWVHEGGPDMIMERLRDEGTRQRIIGDMAAETTDWSSVVLASGPREEYVGLNLVRAAERAGIGIPDLVCDLLCSGQLDVSYVKHDGSEPDMCKLIGHPCHTVSSDGLLIGRRPHPRGWGAFPRFLARYVRDQGLLPLEQAICHMTARSADVLGLADRGRIGTGLAADLVVFDPDAITDTATYDLPLQHPVGIDLVVVNGAVASEHGRPTGVLGGRALTAG